MLNTSFSKHFSIESWWFTGIRVGDTHCISSVQASHRHTWYFKGTWQILQSCFAQVSILVKLHCYVTSHNTSSSPSHIRPAVGRMYQQQGCEVMVTGHSLGGYLAEVVATSLGESSGGNVGTSTFWWKIHPGGCPSSWQTARIGPRSSHVFFEIVAFLWLGLSCISCNQNIPSCPVLHPWKLTCFSTLSVMEVWFQICYSFSIGSFSASSHWFLAGEVC